MLRFLCEILIPLRDFYHQVARSVRDALATQSGFYREAGRVVELIEFRIRRLVARLEPFVHDDVKNDPGIYPPPELRQKLAVQLADSPDQTRAITRLWQKFKTGQ